VTPPQPPTDVGWDVADALGEDGGTATAYEPVQLPYSGVEARARSPRKVRFKRALGQLGGELVDVGAEYPITLGTQFAFLVQVGQLVP
jgi:hypothetical protein